jgi:hypothetical protein
MQQSYLAVSAAADISMSPSINGLTGGIGTGSTSWTVITDNAAGYTLSARATTSPAMQGVSASFSDYGPKEAEPDYSWSVASSAAEFGFSPEGGDVVQRYKDDGGACNTGSGETADKCWDGFDTTGKTMAEGLSNHPEGIETTVKVQAESGTSFILPSGDYSATIVVTALPL